MTAQLGAAIVPNECVMLGLENDCTVVAALNPVNELKLKLGLENDCAVVAALKLTNKRKLKLGLENVCTVKAALNPANENRLKLKQGGFEQERVLEHVAQTPLVLAGTYDTHDSVDHGSNESSDA